MRHNIPRFFFNELSKVDRDIANIYPFCKAMLKICSEHFSAYPHIPKKYIELSADMKLSSIAKMISSSYPDQIYRGVKSINQMRQMITHDKIGHHARSPEYDIVNHVMNGKNPNFLSFTGCVDTAHNYAFMSTILPKVSYILITGKPLVQIIPELCAELIPEDFHRFDANSQENEFQKISDKSKSTIEQAIQSKEITQITTGPNGEDWRSTFHKDVSHILQLGYAGALINYTFKGFDDSVHLNVYDNPKFKLRPFSLIIFNPNNIEDLPKMNKRAIKQGAIMPGARLLTIKDASAILNNHQFMNTCGDLSVNKTIEIKSVPSDIQIGDTNKLVQYVEEKIDAILSSKDQLMP